VTAAVALLTLLLLAPLIRLMPQAALAVVVVAYSVGLIKPTEFYEIRRVRQTEFRWALIAFAGVVLLGTLQGIVVAVIVSLLSLAQQAYSPQVYALERKPGTQVYRTLSGEHPGDENWPGLLIVRIDGRLFFANAQRVGNMLSLPLEQSKTTVLLLDFSSVIDIEYTALKMLTDADLVLRQRGTTLWLR
jgi:SulP family sulfate permease